jgi:uncharacterized membrane protein YeaQ/YmgE (transglycosylase-associated protein family)
MGIISWIILGLIAGFIASKIVSRTGSGLILDLVLGVTGLNLWSIIVSLIGAAIVLWICEALVARSRARSGWRSTGLLRREGAARAPRRTLSVQ